MNDILDDKLLGKGKNSKPYYAYENQNYESPLSRFLPSCLFKLRWVSQNFLNRKLFRVLGMDFTLGGIVFFAMVLSALPIVEYVFLSDEENRQGYTGLVNFTLLSLVFSFSSRNSIWALIVGLSVERAIFWHKLFSGLLLISGLIHGYINSWGRLTGIILYSSIVLIFISSLWFIRRNFYYYFYLLHVLLIFAIGYNLYNHAFYYGIIAFSFYLFDLVVRTLFHIFFVIRGSSYEISLSQNRRFVVLKSKNRIISHRPGQYFFMVIPKISVFEPHPFSATSDCDEDRLIFYIRSNGDWTSNLVKVAEKQSEVTAFINGPYGIPTVDVENRKIKYLILIAGGIGMNFIKPYIHHFLTQVKRGRKIKMIKVFWSVRETELLELYNFSTTTLEAISEKEKEQKSISFPNQNEVDFDLRVFLKSDLESFTRIKTPIKNCVKRRNLDLRASFSEFAVLHPRKKASKVKVMCCGPDHMIKDAFDLAKKYNYDIHCEYFEV
jgi:NAD(P)H-flavin reductase